MIAPFRVPETTTAAPAIGPTWSETIPVIVPSLTVASCAKDEVENKTFSATAKVAAKHQKTLRFLNVLFIETCVVLLIKYVKVGKGNLVNLNLQPGGGKNVSFLHKNSNFTKFVYNFM